MRRILVLLALAAAAACGDDEGPFCEPGLTEHYQKTATTPGYKAYIQWCEDPADPGVRHGHFYRWHDFCGRQNEGRYNRGEECGSWYWCTYRAADRSWDCGTRDFAPCPEF